MARNLPEPPPRPRQSVYWRRRAAVLAAGIGVISFLGWSVAGILGGAGHANGAARPTSATAPAVSGAATGSAAPRRPPGARAAGTQASTRSSAGARGKAGAGSGGGAGSGSAAGSSARPGGASGAAGPSWAGPQAQSPPAGLPPLCPPHDVVLSLASGQGGYGPAAQPQFTVFVVSVGARDCSADIGPSALSVVVRAGGTGRVWDSADCAPAGSRFAQLSRGVPRVLHFRWDRRASSPGCRQAGGQVRLGTYTATAIAPAAHLASQGTVFVLTGPGVGMP